jgi:hypothetical protein
VKESSAAHLAYIGSVIPHFLQIFFIFGHPELQISIFILANNDWVYCPLSGAFIYP